MMQYCKSKENCRRELLFQEFDEYNRCDAPTGCLCCDLCAPNCTCLSCDKFYVIMIHSMHDCQCSDDQIKAIVYSVCCSSTHVVLSALVRLSNYLVWT